MKTKYLTFIFLITLSFLSLMPFVSAQSFSFEGTWDYLQNIISYVLGDISGGGEILLIKFLVFLLILAITSTALRKVPGIGDNESTVKVVAIIIGLMATRYMTTESIINFIWLPYGALGILLSSLLPFIIFFFFVESMDSSFIRRMGWISFAVIYLALAYIRFDDFIVGGAWWENLALVYVLVGLLAIMIIPFEKKLHAIIVMSSIKKGYDTKSIILKTELEKELGKINSALASPSLNTREASKLTEEKRRIETAIRRIRT
jgi:signal transduction histidine kinase